MYILGEVPSRTREHPALMEPGPKQLIRENFWTVLRVHRPLDKLIHIPPNLGLCKHGERQEELGCSNGDGGTWSCWAVQNQAGNKMSLCLSLLLNYNAPLPRLILPPASSCFGTRFPCLVRWGSGWHTWIPPRNSLKATTKSPSIHQTAPILLSCSCRCTQTK